MSSSAERKRALVNYLVDKIPISARGSGGRRGQVSDRNQLESFIGVYTVTVGNDKPSSISDQIFKARHLIDYIFKENRLRVGDNLLIIGAGAAGASAAWHAVERGVNTTLQDLAERPFSAQAGCSHRWLHPHEYRWPEKGYTGEFYPAFVTFKVPPILFWEAELPSTIAEKWRQRFVNWTQQVTQPGRGRIQWDPGKELPRWRDKAHRAEILREVALEKNYHVILLCAGATEKCIDPNSEFRSFPFWGNDPYGVRGHGAPASYGPMNILVSGGGDGALQDFIRLACPRSASISRPTYALSIFKQLQPILKESPAYRMFLRRLRALRNSCRPKFSTLNETIDAFLRDIRAPLSGGRIRAALDLLVDPAIKEGRKVLVINARDFVPPASSDERERRNRASAYTLNVFLVRMLAWRIQELTGTSVFLPDPRHVARVRFLNSAHVCRNDPADCVLKPHQVDFDDGGNRTTTLGLNPYDLIVLRHGVEPVFLSARDEERRAAQA